MWWNEERRFAGRHNVMLLHTTDRRTLGLAGRQNLGRFFMAQTVFPAKDHDHAECIAGMLARAEHICGRRQARLTPLRRRVFEIIASSHEALGAYDILGKMAKRTAPVTVYRALDFLTAHGLVHRIATDNAYVACSGGHAGAQTLLLICSRCKTVGEAGAGQLARAVASSAQRLGFAVDREIHEVLGLCRHCRAQ